MDNREIAELIAAKYWAPFGSKWRNLAKDIEKVLDVKDEEASNRSYNDQLEAAEGQ